MPRDESTTVTQSVADEIVSLEEILAELDGDPKGDFPERALRGAQRRRDEIIPHLIELIRRDVQFIRDGKKLPSDVSFFALFLLAEFKAREALPVLVEALSLPEDGPYTLFSDAITERLDAMLAALAADDLEVIEALIRNRRHYQYVRWAAAGAYLCLVRDGRMTPAEAINRLQRHLQTAIAEKDDELATAVIDELFNYAPQEALGDVRKAFSLNLVDESVIDLEYFERHVRLGETHFLDSLENCRPTGIEDTVEVISQWSWIEEVWPEDAEHPWDFSGPRRPISDVASYSPLIEMDRRSPEGETVRYDAPRVGRNDPCPCGSGRKFKKCCGKS